MKHTRTDIVILFCQLPSGCSMRDGESEWGGGGVGVGVLQ